MTDDQDPDVTVVPEWRVEYDLTETAEQEGQTMVGSWSEDRAHVMAHLRSVQERYRDDPGVMVYLAERQVTTRYIRRIQPT
jgi:hypothetical protein